MSPSPPCPPPVRTRRATVATLVAITGLLLAGASTQPATARPAAARPAAVPAAAPLAVLPTAYVPSSADRRLASALTARVTTARFGTAFSGSVIDMSTNATLWQRNRTTALIPASTTKLVTAANALTVLGPDRTFTTSVRTGLRSNQVVVVGVGDPALSSRQLDRLAQVTAADLTGRGLGSARVYIDDDVFPTPTLATGWKSSYVPDAITPVRGLVRDQRDLADTGADVGTYFAQRLVAWGVPTATYLGRTDPPSSSRLIATSRGSSVASSVSRMLMHSDNEIAEALHKQVGIAVGTGATWQGARSAQVTAMRRQGLAMTALHDGSGLSRSNRLTSYELARLVDRGLTTSYGGLWPMRSAAAMPTAGRTGTLDDSLGRFTAATSRCATGKVWGKTGRLSDVTSFAGWTVGADGRVKVFAFVVNGRSSTLWLRQQLDMLAATVNGCY